MKRPTQKEFLRLAVPNVLTNLTVPLAGLIDMALLGHLEDVSPLAGVALASLIFDYTYWTLGFLRMGTTGLTANAYGARDREASAGVFVRSAFIALLIGLAILVLQKPLGDLSFLMLSGEAAVEHQGRLYFDMRIWAAPATLGGYVIVGWMLGMQRARAALLYSTVLNGLNIVMDYIFIYKWGMGAAGAGLATMVASYGALLVGLGLMLRFWEDHPKPRLSWLAERDKLMELMQLQRDIFIRTLCMITTFFLFTNLSATFGQVVLAANTILFRVLNTAAYFIDGFAYALESLAGRFQGSNDPRGVRRSLLLSLYWNIGVVVVFIQLFWFADREILSWLTHHVPVIEAAQRYMPYVSLCLLMSGFAYIYDGFFIGLTRGRILRNSMLVSIAGFAPFALYSYLTQNQEALWWGMTAFMGLRALTLALASRPYMSAGLEPARS
ncbi:MATE family efflux transporter [Sulfidibacter corallicola]|uniref:MATE family efflux transporter n=1 Tax=Sulfidibacter corallicola TaxID=2818388 RepID=A0A8A4TNL0_SULCO|nr:MATE family efflux transporter [Sulfidibacter corallicola]QTD50794.1 MATE family efflux transporter [Sulfidibacter corallicola]